MEIGHSDLYAHYADDNKQCEDTGEVEDVKYVNTQDYLDIGETVFNQQNRAAPEVATTIGFIKEELIDPDDAQILAVSEKTKQLINKKIEVSQEIRTFIKAEEEINAGLSIISKTEDGIIASDIKEPCRSSELQILREQVASWRVVLHRLPTDALLPSTSTPDEDKHSIFTIGDAEKTSKVSSKVDTSDDEFKGLGYLKTHRKTHSHKKPLRCEVRGLQFAFNSTLINHIRRDTRERPFKCKICSHRCIRKEHLKYHMRSHTGKKLYKCEICDSSFSSSSGLKIHVRTHTGEKPYKCDLCHYRFTQTTHLKNHMSVHSRDKPFKCEICDYQSVRKADLQRHMRLHTGKNTFNCDLCDRRCVQKISLQDHMMLCHLGKKPYKCDLCNYRCIRKAHLTSHLRTHSVKKRD